MMLNYRSVALCLGLSTVPMMRAGAVNFLATADPTHNTSTPGDNSGWQFEGRFGSFLGVPIAPYFFITAAHIGGSVGAVFDFHGDGYTTIAKHSVGGTDLMIWEVDHAKPFLTYAPLSSGVTDIGAVATVIGRGKQRGTEVFLGAVLKGWNSGTSDGVPRWGRNVIKAEYSDSTYGKLLGCEFNNPGITDECHLSVGDSGGGVWVLENGLWRLAGINYAVDGSYRVPPSGPSMGDASLFDTGGLESYNGTAWTSISDKTADKPVKFYSSRISAHLAAIRTITGDDGSLAVEDFSAWQKLYFSPAELLIPEDTGALADFDKDGICNLLEFALNLEPGFNARTEMTAGSGISGLPRVETETIFGVDHLTLEFVRRTSSSGAGLVYTPEFASTMGDWTVGGTETLTPINSRWERVKVVDAAVASGGSRFTRLRVRLAD